VRSEEIAPHKGEGFSDESEKLWKITGRKSALSGREGRIGHSFYVEEENLAYCVTKGNKCPSR